MTLLRTLGLCVTMATPCLPLSMCVDSMQMVREAGYTPMRPPSTLYGPGAIVGVERRGDYIEIFGICGVRGSLGSGFVPISGPTQREELSRAAKKRFKIGAQFLEELKVDATFKHIRSIHVAFENPRIMALQIEDVIANMQFRDEDCKLAIEAVKSRGDCEVSMVTSTLEGDLIYSIAWEVGYDVDVTTAIPVVASLAAVLGVGQAHCTSRTISSRSLIWGIKDDLFLAELSIRGSAGPRILRRISSRAIPPDHPVDLTADPLAPIVPSTDERNAQYRSSSTQGITRDDMLKEPAP